MTAIILQFAPMARNNRRSVENPPNRIREVREAKGLTQTALGDRLDMLPGEISRFETGARPLDLPKLARFAKALGVRAGELLPLHDQGFDDEERLILDAVRADPRTRRMFVATAREALTPEDAPTTTAA